MVQPTTPFMVEQIVNLSPGALLGKMDIRQAYRNIPMSPDDSRLLGMQWEGNIYADKALPFGLCSAPIIFSAVGDALQWIMLQDGALWVGHYLDDFITLGPADSNRCQENMAIMEGTCYKAGLRIEPSKSAGPTKITFLGMELDTVAGVIRLPADKLHELQELLNAWHGKKGCTMKDLKSIVGLLNHACKTVHSRHSFL